MKTKKGTVSRTDRRDFLKLASVGAVAGGVAALGATKTGEAAAVEGPKGRGYRESGHVRTYYRTARF